MTEEVPEEQAKETPEEIAAKARAMQQEMLNKMARGGNTDDGPSNSPSWRNNPSWKRQR